MADSTWKALLVGVLINPLTWLCAASAGAFGFILGALFSDSIPSWMLFGQSASMLAAGVFVVLAFLFCVMVAMSVNTTGDAAAD